MNSENFHEYVKNPSMLHQVSYQELKSLVLQYPYSPNLRYLLLLKSLFDQSKDFDKNQALASLSSPDRKKLRQLVKQYSRLREIQENYALSEDFLELKDLSVLENLIAEQDEEAVAPAQGSTGFAEAIVPPPPPAASLIVDLDEEIEEESDLGFLEELRNKPTEPIAEAPLPTASGPAPADVVEPMETIEEIAQEEAPETANLAETTHPTAADAEEAAQMTPPQAASEIPLEITNEPDLQQHSKPRSSFNCWLKKLNPPQAGVLKADLKDISLNSRQLQHPEEEKEISAKQIADHSVEEDEEIATETLALLLERQKFYGKAISMYKRLSLLFPEKSSLFAAKIEELNKKL